jgi:hypothetical protein
MIRTKEAANNHRSHCQSEPDGPGNEEDLEDMNYLNVASQQIL